MHAGYSTSAMCEHAHAPMISHVQLAPVTILFFLFFFHHAGAAGRIVFLELRAPAS